MEMNELLDTTIRPICFNINRIVNKSETSIVGPEKFKRYEHTLYIMAQLARIIYCDSGILWSVINSSLGRSNDIVNKVITAYDSIYAKERRQPITSQSGEGTGRPMESYSLVKGSGENKYGTYISTPDDMTCLFVNASKVAKNPNSILSDQDIIVSFKGSSTMANMKHDLMTQFTATDLGKLIASLGIKVEGTDNFVVGSLIKPLINAWPALIQGLSDHCKLEGTRLFLTGHSLGGGYCSLFAFILAEAKVSGAAFMKNIASIHLITFGALTLLGGNARNTFNRHLDSGLITLDRIVSQKIPARSAATQLLMGGPVGPNDVIPNIPARFSHPGYRPLATEIRPEANGRPYSIENIRNFYGAPSKTRYREPTTWPFPNDLISLGDRAQSATLKQIVTDITQIPTALIPEPSTVETPVELKELDVPVGDADENPTTIIPELAKVVAPVGDPTKGGFFSLSKAKSEYNKVTKYRMPNFISIKGSIYALSFAHAEYLGMFFMGGFRLPGMKNPASISIAYFALGDDGVKIQYLGLPTKFGGRHNKHRSLKINRRIPRRQRLTRRQSTRRS